MKTVLSTIIAIAILSVSIPVFAVEQVKVFTTSNYGGDNAGAKELQSEVNAWLKKNSSAKITQRFMSIAGAGAGSGQIHYTITIFYETNK